MVGEAAVLHFCEVFGGSESEVNSLCRDKFEVKEGRPCRAEKSASSRLADKRCSWEPQLGTESMVNGHNRQLDGEKTEICFRILILQNILYSHASFLCLLVWGSSWFSVVNPSIDSSFRSRLFLLSNTDLLSVARGCDLDAWFIWSDESPNPESSICVVLFVFLMPALNWITLSFGELLLWHGDFWFFPSTWEAISLEACGFSPSPCLPNIPSLLIIPFCRRKWSMRLFSWGLGRGWDVEVKGTPVKGSFGGRPQVASLFWCSSRVVLSTDTPLGSSMGSSITSWVIGSRNSSGMETLLESDKKPTGNYKHCEKIHIFYYHKLYFIYNKKEIKHCLKTPS